MRSAMSITFDLEACLKVTAHLLPRSSVYVKYDLDMAKVGVNIIHFFAWSNN